MAAELALGPAAARRWFVAVGTGGLLMWIFLLAVSYSRSCQFEVFDSVPTFSKMVGSHWGEPSCAFMVTLGLFGGTTAMQLLLPYILHVIVLTQRALRRGYYAAVSWADEKLGELLTALERLGLANGTLVLANGDHGKPY